MFSVSPSTICYNFLQNQHKITGNALFALEMSILECSMLVATHFSKSYFRPLDEMYGCPMITISKVKREVDSYIIPTFVRVQLVKRVFYRCHLRTGFLEPAAVEMDYRDLSPKRLCRARVLFYQRRYCSPAICFLSLPFSSPPFPKIENPILADALKQLYTYILPDVK